MEAHARSPRDIFEGRDHFEIPAFQRPYVWNEEDQWAPLWDDVVRVADSYVTAKLGGTDPKVPHHFLGAVVYESKPLVTGDVARHEVIDGQQRMTTLQVLIDATHDVLEEQGFSDLADTLDELTRNRQNAFRGKRERFKLWPSQTDRAAFIAVMDGSTGAEDHPLRNAHSFFLGEVRRWVAGEPDEDGVIPAGSVDVRVEALASTLQDRLLLVAIDLTGHDDSQLIFETLNDRGTPLLKADLVKNWVFRRAEQVGADTEQWASTYWADFDSPWWRAEITQGRLTRSRVDIFLQYWLTMRLTEEIKAEQLFRVFVEHAEPQMTDAAASERLLAALRQDADTYKGFAQLDASTPAGHYYRLVIETMELAVTTPVFLWLLSSNHSVPDDQRALGLAALESWVIRRSLLRLTTKDLNKFMVALLKVLDSAKSAAVGERLREHLSQQASDARFWPSDQHMSDWLPQQRIYGQIRQSRIRAVFAEVESYLRSQSAFYEAVSLPAGLEVEHIMPQGWRSHWDAEPPLDQQQASRRDIAVNTLGNLTLTTRSLNASLSNRPWTDHDATGLKDGGFNGQGKHSLLTQFSLLAINKQILQHAGAWTEEDIADRSRSLTQVLCAVWPGPDIEAQQAALEALRSAQSVRKGSLDEVPWTAADMQRLANEAGELMTAVLDVLAAHPGQGWSNRQLDAAGVRSAYTAVGALGMKARGFGRSNSPIEYEKCGNEWLWSLPPELAEAWRAGRAASQGTTA
ncbi:MAG TPA: DUF262 domain-containing HNH endonuclease family protein [Propioniciclava tarda]|nr:DUF262 domain-containing HNH endonuclease family protein [Propioniciclava tarda]